MTSACRPRVQAGRPRGSRGKPDADGDALPLRARYQRPPVSSYVDARLGRRKKRNKSGGGTGALSTSGLCPLLPQREAQSSSQTPTRRTSRRAASRGRAILTAKVPKRSRHGTAVISSHARGRVSRFWSHRPNGGHGDSRPHPQPLTGASPRSTWQSITWVMPEATKSARSCGPELDLGPEAPRHEVEVGYARCLPRTCGGPV